MAKKKIDIDGLTHRVERAANNHSHVRATLHELLELVKDAYAPTEPPLELPEKPVDSIGKPENLPSDGDDTVVTEPK